MNGNEIGADHVDDEGLGHNGFNEPAGIEERSGVGVVSGIVAVTGDQIRRDAHIVTFENKPHHAKKWYNQKWN